MLGKNKIVFQRVQRHIILKWVEIEEMEPEHIIKCMCLSKYFSIQDIIFI